MSPLMNHLFYPHSSSSSSSTTAESISFLTLPDESFPLPSTPPSPPPAPSIIPPPPPKPSQSLFGPPPVEAPPSPLVSSPLSLSPTPVLVPPREITHIYSRNRDLHLHLHPSLLPHFLDLLLWWSLMRSLTSTLVA
jgi:hypothetical protein